MNEQNQIPVVEVQHLKKYFNTSKGKLHAVDDVNFKIYEGKTLGVVGESGCGKSTLGRTILRLLEPTGGKILFRGADLTALNKKELKEARKKMNMIFQDPYSSIDPRMTVADTIAEPLKIFKVYKNQKEMDEYVAQVMETVGLASRYTNAYPHELDGGRRQRIGVARSLVLNPEFIVCDEPVSALDVSIQAQILNLLMDLQDERKLTYMFITHDMSVVKHISNQIAVMYLGQCVEFSETEELFEEPMHPYTIALLDAIPVPDLSERGKEAKIIRGEVTSPIDPKPGCRFAARCPYATKDCTAGDIPFTEVRPGHFVACTKFS